MKKIQYTHTPGPLAQMVLILFCERIESLKKREAKNLFNGIAKLANVEDAAAVRAFAKERLGL